VGEDVLISGAGPIGLMAAKVARHIGARFIVITDVNESRLELARRMGVDRAINVTTSDLAAVQKELGMKEGFDIAFEMSGNQKALPLLLDNLGHGARIAMLGLPSTPIAIDWAKVVSHMITIKGIYGREMFETWYAMNAMVATGLDISEVITDRFAAADWELAFATARSGNGGKVIMNWSD
jgi:threonine 3-dehydrogenase